MSMYDEDDKDYINSIIDSDESEDEDCSNFDDFHIEDYTDLIVFDEDY
ncbi:MAG: hypothetical protein GX080_08465 [Tissierellia bacterium]|nr:hypothetical protein [Tissierellia bacterium]